MKKKIKSIGLYKNLKLFASKDTNNKVKRQPVESEKIVGNSTSDKVCVSRIYT